MRQLHQGEQQVSRRTRGSGSLDRREGKWQARYVGDDGRSHYKTFKRKPDAERWLRTEIGKVEQGEWTDPQKGRETVGQVAEVWFNWMTTRGKKPTTIYGYRGLLDHRVLPKFGTTQLRHVTATAVRAWLDEMAAEGLSPASQRSALQVLGAVMRRAVKDEKIARNPLDKLDAEDRPRVSTRRQQFLDHFGVKALADAAETQQTGAGVLVRFLAYSGLRWGEAVALRAGKVTEKGGRVKVSVDVAVAEVGGKLIEGTPKTNEQRTLFLPAFMSRLLLEHIEGMEPGDLVFTTPRGAMLRSSNFRLAVWRPAVEASGVPNDLMVHDLRDTAASLAIASGASVKAVQRMLGHKSAAMTLDVYGGLWDEDLETLADRMEAAIPEAVKGA